MYSSSLTPANQRRESMRSGVKPVQFQARPMNVQMQNPAQDSIPAEDYSVWRHTSLRYAGYADEIGEFMTPYTGTVGKFLGYMIAGLYCVADLGTTLTQKFRNAPPEMTTAQKTRKTAAEGADLSFFHLVATLLIPPKIIGAAVETVNHILDKDALKHALDEAPEAGKSSGWLDKLSRGKLQWEKSMNQEVAKHIDPFLHSKIMAKKADPWMRAVKGSSDWLLVKNGSKLVPVVETTAKLAKLYNHYMPFSYFKDEEILTKLQANVDFLKNPGNGLTRKQIAKLAWIKPLPVLVGIGMIPLIAHPFDELMDKIQNWTSRLLLGKNKVTHEDGQLKSVRNADFWGKNQNDADQADNALLRPPATFAGHVLHSPYHRQTARFGVQNYGLFPQQPVRQMGFNQQSASMTRPVYPAGNQGFYC